MLNLDRVFGRPWAVTFEIADLAREAYNLESGAGLRLLADLRQAAGITAAVEAKEAAARTTARRGGNVAVLPIMGMMTLRGGPVNCASTTSSLALRDQVREFAADASVQAIVLEIDSGGGEVDGTPELAAAVREARASKPVVSFANSIAGSAAYWVAAQADEIVVTPSGAVGSVGVFTMHKDDSEAMKAQGRKVQVISAGKYKAEGAAGPLSEDGVAYLQDIVDRTYGAFVADVAKGRRATVDAVRGGYGQGRMVDAKQAVAQGMADSIGTLEEALRRAGQLAIERRSSGQSAEEEADTIKARRR